MITVIILRKQLFGQNVTHIKTYVFACISQVWQPTGVNTKNLSVKSNNLCPKEQAGSGMNPALKPLCHPCFTVPLTTGLFLCPWCDAVGNHLTVWEFGSSSPHWCLGEFCSKQRARQERRQDSGERKGGRGIKSNQSRAWCRMQNTVYLWHKMHKDDYIMC